MMLRFFLARLEDAHACSWGAETTSFWREWNNLLVANPSGEGAIWRLELRGLTETEKEKGGPRTKPRLVLTMSSCSPQACQKVTQTHENCRRILPIEYNMLVMEMWQSFLYIYIYIWEGWLSKGPWAAINNTDFLIRFGSCGAIVAGASFNQASSRCTLIRIEVLEWEPVAMLQLLDYPV